MSYCFTIMIRLRFSHRPDHFLRNNQIDFGNQIQKKNNMMYFTIPANSTQRMISFSSYLLHSTDIAIFIFYEGTLLEPLLKTVSLKL